jgi:hypothetical protein
MRMRHYCATLCVLFSLVLVFPTTPTVGSSFDFDHGNAAIEVVIPAAIPAILQTVSPGAGDASLVLRITTIITNAWFDAIAPLDSQCPFRRARRRCSRSCPAAAKRRYDSCTSEEVSSSVLRPPARRRARASRLNSSYIAANSRSAASASPCAARWISCVRLTALSTGAPRRLQKLLARLLQIARRRDDEGVVGGERASQNDDGDLEQRRTASVQRMTPGFGSRKARETRDRCSSGEDHLVRF